VVAAEVRKLAERSQVAAQEISHLAGSSVGLAEQAGRVLAEMVPTIRKTSELVQEISASSGEQATGVSQINTAMNHLNTSTQQNASASEQLSATAEELSGQATQLQSMLNQFRLAPGAPAMTPAPAPAPARAGRVGENRRAPMQAAGTARGDAPAKAVRQVATATAKPRTRKTRETLNGHAGDEPRLDDAGFSRF
jgi:methyl-accepting chemotaxis protein